MSFDAQRLFELLPAIYRIRDAEQGDPLKALVGVIADQIGVLEGDLAQLYDDQFIETCADWVVPYIGDLISFRPVNIPGAPVSRAEVAHTIAFRRRKGTAAMLEQLARDITSRHARVVEFFQLLAWTQHMNHLRPGCLRVPDLRQAEALDRLGGPFESAAHLVDVRQPAIGGKYNIPNVGIYLWRLNAYSLTGSPAAPAVPGDKQRFLFNPMGLSAPLFTMPVAETDIEHLADPVNVPNPISRTMFAAHIADYFGAGKSINIDGVTSDNVCACNLSDSGASWAHTLPAGKVGIDPVLGRIAFGDVQANPPVVSFHYGFGVDIGGGEYNRVPTKLQVVARVPTPVATIQAGLDAAKSGGAVEILDSGRYREALKVAVDANAELELRAANQHRPTILPDGEVLITGAAGSTLILSGLVIGSTTLRIPASADNRLRSLVITDCTLVPSAKPSLIVEAKNVAVTITRSIVGGLRLASGTSLTARDSIIDATQDSAVAIAALDELGAGGLATVETSTIVGKVHVEEFVLASNSLFEAVLAKGDPWTADGTARAPVRAERRQAGCVRFCYLPADAIVPRGLGCVPRTSDDALRVVPRFTSKRYGDPGYGQMVADTATEIRYGADDEGEIGAFHMLYLPQREASLRVRLKEYLRVGLEAGIYYAT